MNEQPKLKSLPGKLKLTGRYTPPPEKPESEPDSPQQQKEA